jgi:tRNA dimethylallyltransferase
VSDSATRVPRLLAILGPTATGKSTLGIAMASRYGGEVVACDSTAVYRGFDIGTDKVGSDDQHGIAHHMVDVADPLEDYSAARYAREAERVIRDITARGRLPVLVGGTGFYYRALTRGLFPGPGRDVSMRARLVRISEKRGPEHLHRWLTRVDPESGVRIQPRDLKRIVRALEVYCLTGRPLTRHFEHTRAPLADYSITALALTLPPERIAERVARRVDAQFARGVVSEVQALLSAGLPESAQPFSGLVYRQVLEYLHGVRGESETRDLIVRENRRYARRQLIWFRKEPNLQWIHGAGEDPQTLQRADELFAATRPL